MALLVTAATPQELYAALPALQGGAVPEHKVLCVPHSPVLACLTGVGPVNAGIALGAALQDARVHAVCNVGLAGSFHLRRLPLRSLVLVTEEIFPEYGMNTGRSVHASALGFAQWQHEGKAIYDRLPLACALEQLALPAHLPRAASLTVAGVSASPARARALHKSYGAGLENMEGFAVALACAQRGKACMEIRCVSNKVGAQHAALRDFSGALAAMRAALPALFAACC
ncbi:MAG: futalosine hydrolase [Desulfovibrionaceae bacterium]|nr:futalosine hydrolase [Desulfovibrionaceae bacterium]